jgi:hypothetical protein
LRLFLEYWEPSLENEEIEIVVKCTLIVSLPKEEEPIAPTMDDEVCGEHVEEEVLHEEHDLIENHINEEEGQTNMMVYHVTK